MSEDGSYLGKIRGWKRTIRFALPSIATMLFISSYSIVDGAFISNFVDTNALASLNILTPVATLLTGVGFMFSTGGSAYVSNLLGQGDPKGARAAFSQITLALVIVSIVFTVLGSLFIGPIVTLLGADEILFDGCVEYGSVYVLFTVFLTIQFLITQFLIVLGRPKTSLLISLAAGFTNIILDYVLIVVLDMGLTGAALASGMSSVLPFLITLPIFMDKKEAVHFTAPSRDLHVILKSSSNGISEMVGELSSGITTLFYNLVMMNYIGADGVAAITILSYVQFLSLAAIIGYSNGVSPIMSYNHGAEDREGMQGLFKISASFVIALSLVSFLAIELFSPQIAGFFASGSAEVMELTIKGGHIYAFGFLFMGMNLYASSLFTSLSNGLVSAIISAAHSLILLAPSILLLPMLFGIDAVWYALPLTEAVSLLLSLFFIIRSNSKYGYMPERHPVTT